MLSRCRLLSNFMTKIGVDLPPHVERLPNKGSSILVIDLKPQVCKFICLGTI